MSHAITKLMYNVEQWLGNVRFSWRSLNISVGIFPFGYNGGLQEVGHSPPARGYVNCGWGSLNVFNMRCGLLKLTQCEMDLGGRGGRGEAPHTPQQTGCSNTRFNRKIL